MENMLEFSLFAWAVKKRPQIERALQNFDERNAPRGNMFNLIDIISIPVKDQTVSKKFYQELLGFELVSEGQMGPDQVWIQLRPSSAETSITLVTWFEAMPAGSMQGLVLDTDNVEQTRAKLISNELEIS